MCRMWIMLNENFMLKEVRHRRTLNLHSSSPGCDAIFSLSLLKNCRLNMITPEVKTITEHSSHIRNSPRTSNANHTHLTQIPWPSLKCHDLFPLTYPPPPLTAWTPFPAVPTHPWAQLAVWDTLALFCPQDVWGLTLQLWTSFATYFSCNWDISQIHMTSISTEISWSQNTESCGL